MATTLQRSPLTPPQHHRSLPLYAPHVDATWAPHHLRLGLVVIGVILGLAAATTRAFWRIRPLAGGLLLPYLAWLCFATALNLAIDQLNPGA